MKLAEHEITPMIKKRKPSHHNQRAKKLNINKCESNNESAGKPN